jgi:hypothetical protein
MTIMPNKLYSWLKKGMIAATLLLANMAHAQMPCFWIISPPYAVPQPGYYNPCQTAPSSSYTPTLQKIWTTGAIQNLYNGVAPAASNGCSAGGYSFRDSGTAAKWIKANAGSSFTLNVVTDNAGLLYGSMGIWIDWNHDGHFDVSDKIPFALNQDFWITQGKPFNPWTKSITVPATAQNGFTRMRVRLGTTSAASSPVAIPGPCDTSYYGETEDYMVEVVNPCLEPAVISISNVTCSSADIGWSTRGNATFYDVWVDTILAPWSRADAPDCFAITGCTNPKGCCKFWHPFSTTQTSTSLPGPVNGGLVSDKKYYVCIRSICDTFLKPLYWDWDTSAKWAIDSFNTLPCCSDPVVTCTGHTATTLSFSWAPVYTAHAFEYIMSTDPNLVATNGTVITGNSITVPGLPSNSRLYFYLRALCNPTPSSNWVKTSCATDNTLVINNLQAGIADLIAYPNPAKDIVTVEAMGGIVNNATLTITNLQGTVVFRAPMKDTKIHLNTSAWAKGIYIVKFADETSNKVIKITKD